MGSSSTQHQDSTQNFNTASNSVMTPTNPQFVAEGLGNFGSTLNNLNTADPYSFVAGPDALQTQAAGTASGLSGTPWAYDGATDVTRGIAQMDAPDIASLMAPFKGAFDNRVINPALAAFDQNAALTNAQTGLDRAQDTTFGGSGGAITDALTRGQLALSRGQLQGGLLSDQFKTALGGAEAQANTNLASQQQRLGAAGQIADIADRYGANSRANAGTQADIGTILQQLAQAKAGAPLNVAGSLSNAWGTLPLGLLHGVNTNGTTSGTQTGSSDTSGSSFGASGTDLANMAMAAMFLSDRRLKRDIVKVGARPDGLGFYLFRYLWSPAVHLGVMAQEVLKVKPEAVVTLPSGFMAVNYGAL